MSGTDTVVWDSKVRHKHTLLLSCTDIILGDSDGYSESDRFSGNID